MNHLKLTAFFIFTICHFLSAQLPGTNDPTFNVYDDGYFGNAKGLQTGVVNSIVLQPDGKILVGGEFTVYNGIPVNRLMRLNSDGGIDNSFDLGTGFPFGAVNSIVMQPDGKILVGGTFSSYNGASSSRIVRLLPNGDKDLTFSSNITSGSSVTAMVLQPDGKIIIGGEFTTFTGSVNRFKIARLNEDGTLDLTFNPGSSIGTGGLTSFALQPDGKLFIAGSFTSYNGTARNRIARVHTNGSLDMLFNPGTGFTGTTISVNDIALQDDGKLFAVGAFFSYNGTSVTRVARINSDGTLDLTFTAGSGFNNTVETICLLSDGYYIGGHFTAYKGTTLGHKGLVKVDFLGDIDNSFAPVGYANSLVTTICLQTDDKILIGGDWVNTTSQMLARLIPAGERDPGFNSGSGFTSSHPRCIVVLEDEKILVAAVGKYNGVAVEPLVRLLPDGELDVSFSLGGVVEGVIEDIKIQDDQKIIVVGNITINGLEVGKIARLNADGSIDNTFNAGVGFSTYPSDVELQSDGKIIAAGGFTSFDGQTVNRICRLNPDGSIDLTFNIGSGFENSVRCIAIQPDDKIVVGGNFFGFNGINRDRIARLNSDGSLDTSFDPGWGFNGNVSDLKLQSDGKIVVVGYFTSYNDTLKNRMIRLNDDASIDNMNFNMGLGIYGGWTNPWGSKCFIQPDGSIIILGLFTHFDGTPRDRVVRVLPNGELDQTFECSPSIPSGNFISGALQYGGTKLVIGGDWSTFNGSWRNRIARMETGDCNTYMVVDSLVCDSLAINGETFTNSGTYYQTMPNLVGCDSLITLNLTVKSSTFWNPVVGVCDSYTLNGENYTTSGIYSQVLNNINGCDSTITLDLTIYSTSDTLNVTACDSYTLGSETYTSSGSFTQMGTNINGCDSVVVLNLILNNSTNSVLSVIDCDSYTLNGQTYNSTGIYTQYLTNALGCDSTVTIDLILNNSSQYQIDTTVCDSFILNGQEYHSPGVYTQILQNSLGCDSSIIIDLSVSASVTVTQSSNVLNAFPSASIYQFQWVECIGGNYIPITGATNWTYSASSNGDYAVFFTDGNCTDTSSCFSVTTLGTSNPNAFENISFFPNPASDELKFNLELLDASDVIAKIFDFTGREVKTVHIEQSGLTTINLKDLSTGSYFVSLSNKDVLLKTEIIIIAR